MRGVLSVAAMSVLAACGATEGPLLRAVGDAGGGAPQSGSGAAGSQAAAGVGTGADTGEPRIVAGMSFQYQLQGTIDTGVDAELFVVDLFNARQSVIDALHADGRVVGAYVSAGTLENYRDDFDQFPERAVGEPLTSYPNESWLDVRDAEVRTLMAARLRLARDKRFDAVLPTSLTAYMQNSGFDLTAADQLDYTRWLAAEIRSLGMSPGMSGDYAQVDELVASFDWALHSRCIARGTCGELAPFAAAGKPRFDLEYEGEIETICAEAERQQIEAILKQEGLYADREACQ